MPTQDTSQIKEKIISFLNTRGPSLPIHIAGETGLSLLFASAFLSELLSEKRIKISNMKVGNSPLYYISGQEKKLENFSKHLKSKEKEAFDLLKDKGFLEDEKQIPPIRVALRHIRDFAIPFKKGENIYWRYFTIPEEDSNENESSVRKENLKAPEEKTKEDEQKTEEPESKPEEEVEKTSSKTDLNIFDDKKLIEEKKKTKSSKARKKSTKKTSKANDKFFNKVKEFLSKKGIEISDIESFNKNQIILRVKKHEREELLIAYNKKRLNEEDITKAHKKASELGLKYSVISLGEPLKRINQLMEALKDLKNIEKIE